MRARQLIPLIPSVLLLAVLPAVAEKIKPRSSASPALDAARLLGHVKVLASDELEGRAPGTPGEQKTIDYIAGQFAAVGLSPAGVDGTFLQPVPLVGITPDPAMALTFSFAGNVSRLKFRDDFVAWSKRLEKEVAVNLSEVVFVGYGIQAPEFGWDDIKGMDLKGKTLLVLVGDPPVPDPGNPATLDPRVFSGSVMTYYGRWTYKYELGARLGAAAVLIIHETGPAGYPFTVIQGKTGEQLDLVSAEGGAGHAAVEGWISQEQAERLVGAAGHDFSTLKRRALDRAFKPMPLGATASITVTNSIRQVLSHNVVGQLAGSDPQGKREAVIFEAHWDHFGIGEAVDGDRVYHGAVDNATGVAALIELARAFRALPVAPRRSILFLSVTAEEQSLLGSRYYVEHPLVPLVHTAAVINLESLNVLGRTKDVTLIGLGHTELDDLVRTLAARQGRVVRPDPQPEKGSFFRSDHFPFAQAGVPFCYPAPGVDFVGRPAGWGVRMRDEFTARHYHKPSDTVRPDWNLDGAIVDLELCWRLGLSVASSSAIPSFRASSEYRHQQGARPNDHNDL
jgi:Zn-dependent M28 family amino/carboxypeptidase